MMDSWTSVLVSQEATVGHHQNSISLDAIVRTLSLLEKRWLSAGMYDVWCTETLGIPLTPGPTRLVHHASGWDDEDRERNPVKLLFDRTCIIVI